MTRIAKIHVVTIYIRADAPVIVYMSQHVALFNYRAKTKERQYNKGRLLEVVGRKPSYKVYCFSIGANSLVRCRGLI